MKPMSIVAALLILIFTNGCIVRSFRPFYTTESIKRAPDLVGEWVLSRAGKEDLSKKQIKPWIVKELQVKDFPWDPEPEPFHHEYEMLTHDENNLPAVIRVVVFEVDGVMFCDSTVNGPPTSETKINGYWMFHTIPVHLLCKLEIKEDTLTFKPISAEWMQKALKEKRVLLAHENPNVSSPFDEIPLFTAASKDWQNFLKMHHKDPNVFRNDDAFVLKRLKPANP